MTPTLRPLALAAAALLSLPLASQATENQSVRALLGAPGQEMSMPQLPGLYGQLWLQDYRATRFRDGDGADQRFAVAPGVTARREGNIHAQVLVPRLTWVSEARLGEGRLGVSATLPLIHMDVKTRLVGEFPAGTPAAVKAAVQGQLDALAATRSDRFNGVGDMEVAPFVDFQDDESRLVLLAAVVLPTGAYDPARSVNTGSGRFYTLRPGLLWGRAWESGLEMGVRATYSFNTRNSATEVRSGQYLHLDGSALYRLSDQWRVGLGGYALQQTTRDTGAAAAADGGKVRAFALGPTVAWQSLDGTWALEAKWLPEFSVENRPEGRTAWVRLMMRLD